MVDVSCIGFYVAKLPASDFADYCHLTDNACQRLGRHVADFLLPRS